MFFTGKDGGPSIEDSRKEILGNCWRAGICYFLQDDVGKWWELLDNGKIMAFSSEDFEKLILDRWSSTRNTDVESPKDTVQKDNASTNGLTSCINSILQVHGCIQQENVGVFIYPSCNYNLINATLAKRLHVPSKHILSTQVDGNTVEILKI